MIPRNTQRVPLRANCRANAASLFSSSGNVAVERTTSPEQPREPRVESRELRPGPLDPSSPNVAGAPQSRFRGATVVFVPEDISQTVAILSDAVSFNRALMEWVG